MPVGGLVLGPGFVAWCTKKIPIVRLWLAASVSCAQGYTGNRLDSLTMETLSLDCRAPPGQLRILLALFYSVKHFFKIIFCAVPGAAPREKLARFLTVNFHATRELYQNVDNSVDYLLKTVFYYINQSLKNHAESLKSVDNSID